MRYTALSLCIGLIGCQAPALPDHNSYVGPILPPVVEHHRLRHPDKRKKDTTEDAIVADKVEDATPAEPNWTIIEDRFITTHPLELSVEVLHRSEKTIRDRLLTLNKPALESVPSGQ